MAEYYRENSYGLYRLTGDVVGPIKVPGRMAAYEYQRERPDAARVQELIERAIKGAAKEIDLKSFDTHDTRGKKKSDGILDHLMVVYAEKSGRFDGFSPIWPHRGSIDLEVDGVRIASYTILNHAARLGVYVHEFGHDLGLPDLYDRDYSSHGAGDWCTMATGSWLDTAGHPAHISAWGKIRLGWIAPKMISAGVDSIEVPSASEKPFALKVPVGEVDSPEYFLVENRRKVGFDSLLAAEGILIWHIDERKGHNDDEKHKMIDLVEATKDQDLDRIENYTLPKYPPDVFTKQSKAEFSDDTEPSARSYDGSPSSIAIRVLTDPARTMRVSISRPKIFDPGGVPYSLSRDGYNHGRFATVPLGAGSEALMTLDEYRRFTSAVRVPVLANLTEFGRTPLFTVDEMRDAGVRLVLYPLTAFRTMSAAATHAYKTLRQQGTQKELIGAMQTRDELYRTLGYHAYEKKLDELFAREQSDG